MSLIDISKWAYFGSIHLILRLKIGIMQMTKMISCADKVCTSLHMDLYPWGNRMMHHTVFFLPKRSNQNCRVIKCKHDFAYFT